MYKVQNITSGNLSLDLENDGAITLQSGRAFDLEGSCSREWLEADITLKRLIIAGHIKLLHDSTEGLPAQPTHEVVAIRAVQPPAVIQIVTAPAELPRQPIIIDIGGKPDPTPERCTPVEEKVEVITVKESPVVTTINSAIDIVPVNSSVFGSRTNTDVPVADVPDVPVADVPATEDEEPAIKIIDPVEKILGKKKKNRNK
jgi:hypothetical protein